ncbi:MAG: hypothetical protein OXI73_01300, partial [Rhodospirillales bacterium]|nr:hypothetical protein [Rhodospirillales bacterium]
TFWNGVHDSQPASCLRELPEDAPSALVFIAPRERIRGLWSELRTRCQDSPGLNLRDESSRTGDPAWARAGRHVLMIASWRYVLDALRRQAADPGVEQDIDELLGLVDQTDRRAFAPLEPSEVTDVGVARRLIEYGKLVDRIAERLQENGVAKLVSGHPYWGSYRAGWMRYRSMRMHDEFDMRLGIQMKAWQDLGTTPLWCVLRGVVGHWQRIKAGLDDARSYRGRLHIPIRLASDSDEARTIDDAVDQMRHVADRLAAARHAVTSPGPSRSPTRQSLLGQVIPSIKQREPAVTLALQHVLEAAPEVASAFIERLMGGGFETGRIASEWKFGPVQPDLTVFDVHGKARLFIENKFEAPLTRGQPVRYLEKLPRDGQSMLAFIAPDDRAGGLWAGLKERCQRAGYALADESTTKHFRRMRVAKRRLLPPPTRWKWVLLMSWGWTLDTLQQAAAAEGHEAIERDIVQLRGLTEPTTSSPPRSEGHDERPDVSSDARHVGRPDATEASPDAWPATDWCVARRMSNYTGLIDGITDRLVKTGVADTKGLNRSGWGRHLQVRAKFGLWLGVDLHTWRDRGITPIWASFYFGGRVRQAKELFPDAHEDKARLSIPVRLQAGVVRDRVIDDAFGQIRSIADTLLEEFPEE